MNNPSENGLACKHHPDRKAVVACCICDVPLCGTCAKNVNGEPMCDECNPSMTLRRPWGEPEEAEPKKAGPEEAEVETATLPEKPGPLYLLPKERKEVVGAIFWSAVVGAGLGYFDAALWNPWRDGGVPAAVLNLVVFAVWGLVECAGVAMARNRKLARSKGGFVLAGALAGGVWVAIFPTIDSVTDPEPLLSSPALSAIGGLVFGFVVGGGISALCVIRLSGLMAASMEAEKRT